MGLVIITGGIDLSIGSVFALQGIILAIMLREWNCPWPIAVVATVVGTMLLGAMHGFFIAKLRMQAFIVTLCGLLFYRGMARFIANDETKGFGSTGFQELRQLATGSIGPIPMPFVLLIIVGFIAYVVLHRSMFGRYLYAVGRNEDAARYSGINSQMIILGTEMLLVGMGGILIAFLPTRSHRPTTVHPTNSMPLRRQCWEAAACVAEKARFWGSSSARPSFRCSRNLVNLLYPEFVELCGHGCRHLPWSVRGPGLGPAEEKEADPGRSAYVSQWRSPHTEPSHLS
jgi:ABC-type glucose/galactose transport system permease subunit